MQFFAYAPCILLNIHVFLMTSIGFLAPEGHLFWCQKTNMKHLGRIGSPDLGRLQACLCAARSLACANGLMERAWSHSLQKLMKELFRSSKSCEMACLVDQNEFL